MLGLSFNWANAQDSKKGEALFKDNCASCHSRDMKKDMTGPALAGVEDRWSKFPKKELYDWIRNSSGVLGDPSYKSHSYAKGLYASYNNTVMTPFPALTDEDVQSLLVYINNMASAGCAEPPCAAAAADTAGAAAKTDEKEKGSGSTILWALAFVLVMSTILLARYINSLNRLAQQKSGEALDEEKTFFQIVLNPTVHVLVDRVSMILIRQSVGMVLVLDERLYMLFFYSDEANILFFFAFICIYLFVIEECGPIFRL
jgi:cytochrome c2